VTDSILPINTVYTTFTRPSYLEEGLGARPDMPQDGLVDQLLLTFWR